MSLFQSYSRLLQKYPLLIHSVQTGLLVGAGDVLCQTVIQKKEKVNYEYLRTVKFVALGTVIGPSIHTWYSVMDKFLGKRGLRAGLFKVVLDQAIFAPVFIIIFISTISILDGHGLKGAQKKIQQDYVDILLTNYKVWPIVQVVNFFFIPLHYRVLMMQTVALGWNTYLSWKINKTSEEKLKIY